MDATDLHIGDFVNITEDAIYYTGKQISPLVKSKTWEISSISSDRVMLGKSSDGHYNLNAPVNAKFLTKAI